MKRFGNRILYYCGLGVFALISLLMFVPLFKGIFGYGLPSVSKLIFAVIFSVGYFIASQVLRYFLSPHNQKFARSKASASSDDDEESVENEPEIEEDIEETQEEIDIDELEKIAIFKNRFDFADDDEDEDEASDDDLDTEEEEESSDDEE